MPRPHPPGISIRTAGVGTARLGFGQNAVQGLIALEGVDEVAVQVVGVKPVVVEQVEIPR